jgi:response regulator RpfG family c-di-GMP phosphodiesterase
LRSLQRLTTFIIFAGLIWLADALILSLTGHMPLVFALWSGVSQTRLLIRLLVILVILMAGVTSVLRKEMEYMKVLRMNAMDKTALFGAPNSTDKSKRMLYYALRLATLMKMSAREQDNLRKLCYCYDLGMIEVPQEILDQDGKLDAQAQRIWDNHIAAGAEIAANIPQLARISPLIVAHEERYDGGGLQAMYGKSIPLACRIFAAVMLFDEYTHLRPEGRVMDDLEAMDELDMHVGSVLDPEVVEAFHSLFTDRRLASTITARVYMQ